MLLVLSKVLPLFVYPTPLAIMLGCAAMACLYYRKTRWAMGLGLAGILLLWFFALPITTHYMVRSLERLYPQRRESAPAPAIVLLGGCSEFPLPPRRFSETNAAGDRILHAARLYGMGCAPRIIVTGGKISFMQNFPGSEARVIADILTSVMGVDSADIILEEHAKNTHDHAPHVHALLKERRLPYRITLVTSAMHMYRSVKVFEKYGFTVNAAPTDFRTNRDLQYKFWIFFPQARALALSQEVLHEYYGIIAYRILGWI